MPSETDVHNNGGRELCVIFFLPKGWLHSDHALASSPTSPVTHSDMGWDFQIKERTAFQGLA